MCQLYLCWSRRGKSRPVKQVQLGGGEQLGSDSDDSGNDAEPQAEDMYEDVVRTASSCSIVV